MANKRISALDDISLVGGTSTPGLTTSDIIPVTDVDDTTGSLQGTTKKVTVANLVAVAPQGDLESANNLSDLANAATARTNLGLGTAATTASTDYATAAQGATADSATQPGDNISTLTNDSNFIDSSGAPVQSVAGRTGVVTLSNTDVSGLGTAATTASTDYATSAQGGLADTAVQPAVIANMVETTDSIDVLSDVDTSTVAPTTNDLLKWDGTNFVPGTVSVDVDTPLNTALRGTDNPHIGAFPNQSFKVTDNPKKLVMVVATDSGDLDFLLPDGGSIFLNTPTGGRLAPGFGFSVREDATEPDIEVASGGENYSVISGDSDTKGANGLPIRQGFNVPDIGANPAPLLISGGTIA